VADVVINAYQYLYNSVATPRIADDILTISKHQARDTRVKLAICHALAQVGCPRAAACGLAGPHPTRVIDHACALACWCCARAWLGLLADAAGALAPHPRTHPRTGPAGDHACSRPSWPCLRGG
jgi:hypothetical protein